MLYISTLQILLHCHGHFTMACMIHTRKEREILEDKFLSPCAARSSESLGRRHPERKHDYRTEFQRDRDRVLHCRAFRRLEYKTQVYVTETMNDHYRTRLTHTMEMAAIARTIARALNANEDLVEAISLAHDIGHSPFGHSGERELNEIMKDHGGFNHNIQSLRWVELLERRYPDLPGLNLTWEVRAGSRKYAGMNPGGELDGYPIGPQQFMEAQIADISDDIAYQAHDIEDGMEAGLLYDDHLANLDIWREAMERAQSGYPGMRREHLVGITIRYLLDMQVQDVIEECIRRIKMYSPVSVQDIMNCPERIVSFSSRMGNMVKPLREFLYRNVYCHPDVNDANKEAVRMIRRIFMYYIEHPETMGRKARARIPDEGLWRTACDYVSGMTDLYAMQEFRKHCRD